MSLPQADPPESRYRFKRPPWNRPWMRWLLVVAVLIADLYTPPAILFPIFFILPVLLIARHDRLSRALLAVAIPCAVHVSFHFRICPECAQKQYGSYLEKRRGISA